MRRGPMSIQLRKFILNWILKRAIGMKHVSPEVSQRQTEGVLLVLHLPKHSTASSKALLRYQVPESSCGWHDGFGPSFRSNQALKLVSKWSLTHQMPTGSPLTLVSSSLVWVQYILVSVCVMSHQCPPEASALTSSLLDWYLNCMISHLLLT